MLPETGTGEGTEGISEVGTTPSTVGINVGNIVAVGTPEFGAVGVTVDTLESPTGVIVGAGFGGFCQTNINPPIRRHMPITPQPRPLSRNLSKIAKNFLDDSTDRFIFHYDEHRKVYVPILNHTSI
jgi:hypothetical protein